MSSKRNSPISVTIYGEHSDEFLCHQAVLNEQGYKIEAYNTPEQFLLSSNTSDISIVSLSMLEVSELDSLTDHETPFMVYDFSAHFPLYEANPFVHKAVGYFVDKPSPRDISLKVEVGLLLHQERRNTSQRLVDLNQKFEANRDIGIATGIVIALSELSVQEAYDLLRKIARNKRCRLSDIAKALINNQASQDKCHDLASLTQWLEDVVLVNIDRAC